MLDHCYTSLSPWEEICLENNVITYQSELTFPQPQTLYVMGEAVLSSLWMSLLNLLFNKMMVRTGGNSYMTD